MNEIAVLVLKRIGLGILTLFVISILIFVGVEALPGDLTEAILGQNALPDTVAAFRKALKLDLPPHVRYFAWLGDVLSGDLGNSLANGRPITALIGWRLRNTLFLASATAVIAVPGMPLGSPGMEGPNPVEYEVIAYNTKGQTQVYATVQGHSERHE